ncbi:CCE_0567 family metalloprotein [Azonexus hydrophilus]|uniref:CCE_0567 family metalloprotein n=1 Tax=Azonexus hydrophilus TaxID=418702 RepID=UPI00249057B3|nr:CCE_0567 family metalloprotein [Azonexus hydrophilus]
MMTDEELAALDKEVKKLKRIASEWASQMHDLVEDRLPAGYLEIPGIAQSTYDACQAWAEASQRLAAAQKAQTA